MDRPLQAQQETIRIPVYQEEDYDPFGRSLDQTFINCFPEIIKDPTTGEGEVRVIKREGMSTVIDLFSATGGADRTTLQNKANIVVTQLDDVYVAAISDSFTSKIHIVQYRPLAGTTTLIGSIINAAPEDFIHITECQINSTGVKAGITVVWTKADRSVSNVYWAVSDGTKFTATTLTKITNVAFPDQQTPAQVVTGPMQQMNGIFYAYTTNGTLWNSGSTAGTENDPTSWSTLSNILTYQYPDGGIGIYRYKHHLVAYGKNSIEFFNDVGNPPPASRLERTDQAFIRFGTMSPLLVLNVDDTLFWIAYSDSTTLGVWRLDGYTPVKISTGKQDARIFQAIGGAVFPMSQTWLYSIVFQNKKHIGISNILVTTGIISDNPTTDGAQFGSSSDTWYNYKQNTGVDTYGQNLMYSIEDKTWWGLRVDPTLNTMLLLPTANYPGYSTSGRVFYTQYILMTNSTIGNGDGKVNTYVYKLNSAESGSYYDEDLDDLTGAGTKVPYVTVIETNTLTFGNINRKKVSKVQPVFTSIPIKGSSDTGVYSMSCFYNTGNLSTGIGRKEKYVAYPNAVNRYHFNNFGMGRYWNLSLVSVNKDPLSLQGFDVTVHQGTH